MKRRLNWLGMVLALGLVVAACSPAAAPTTTAAPATTTTAQATTTTEAPDELLTDIGVDLEAGTITIGLLSDLSGPFSSLVQVIVAGHEIYWKSVNDAGGIGGQLEVILDVRDTAYDPTQHVQRFNRIPYVKLLGGVGIDAAISSRLMAASTILRFVRQGRVEQVATFSDTDAEAIEIEVSQGSEAVGKSLLDLNLPVGVIIGGISRNGTTFVPDGSSVVREGDHIIFFALPRDIATSTALFGA